MEQVPASASPAKPHAIWIVDDSPLQAELAGRALGEGYEITTFLHGASMLERIAHERPSLLLLDWYMPQISGADICRFVRERHDAASLPIALFSANPTRETLLEAFECGANDYLSIPFDAAELRARVAALLQTKRVHEDLATARARLAADAEFRERFIGMLGHDLRQPLNTFVIGTQALMRRDLGEQEAMIVRRLAAASKRMNRMIAQMLDFTRTRLGPGIPITREACDLGVIGAHVVDEIRFANPTREIVFEVIGDARGSFDADRIAQVFSNLVGNGLEHGALDGVVTAQVRDAGARVLIEVHNTGEPIPAELGGTLFEPFKRGSRSGHAHGLGLGLYIVQGIVSAHGGALSFESNASGTTLRADLPR